MSILGYLEGKEPDHRGRFISEIWRYPDLLLEGTHDYIQWFFPLTEPSNSSRNAPVLTEADIQAILHSPQAQQNLRQSFEIMIAFLGLTWQNEEIVPARVLDRRFDHWLKPYNHNQKRLSRMMTSLALLGQIELAKKLQKGILLANELYGNVSEECLTFWRKAV